jgi:hypothetical protein
MQARDSSNPRPGALLAPLRNTIYRRLWVATLFSNFGVWI